MAYATVDELAAALRVRVTVENTPGLQACLDAAAFEINHDIDAPPGALASAVWSFQVAIVAADPGPGGVRRNKASAAATSELYLSHFDIDGIELPDLTLTTDDRIRMRDYSSAFRWDDYLVTAPAVEHGTWVTVPVDLVGTSAQTFAPAEGEPVLLSGARPSPILGQELALAGRVNILRGVEWYKAQDAAFGVIGFAETGALQAPRDGFNRHAYTLTPLKQRWGLA